MAGFGVISSGILNAISLRMIKLSSDNKDDKKETRKVIDVRVTEVQGFNLILEWGKRKAIKK